MNARENTDAKMDWLVVVPTQFELGQVQTKLEFPNSVVEVCGFGPIVSSARTAQLINQHNPRRVLLIGIAGAYGARLEIGGAYSFSNVGCYGVGAGIGSAFQTAGEMGWKQWPDEANSIGDQLPLSPVSGPNFGNQLLTVCSAAGSRAEVDARIAKFPDAIAEDMEGFSVASACQLFGVPLSIIRGISNRAGDRDKSNWKIKEALEAVAKYCRAI